LPQHQEGRIHVRRTVTHVPRTVQPHPVRYSVPRDYYRGINRRHIYRRWVQVPVIFHYQDGYWAIDNYPYYVHRGFRYRYSPIELCQYELVDGDTYQAVKTYHQKECNIGFNECALERDRLNSEIGMERYFCAEAVDDDLVQQDTTIFAPTPIEIDEARRLAITTYLKGKSLLDIMTDGYRGGVGECLVYKLRGNADRCGWIVTVGDEYFPDTEGGICSAPHKAALVGCNVGTEQQNVGCILKKAIEEGYCH
jgi:hypothetical protein